MTRLKELRTAKNLSQIELAQIVGCSRMAISRWEQTRLPTGKNLMRLAQVLDTTPNDLLGVQQKEEESK